MDELVCDDIIEWLNSSSDGEVDAILTVAVEAYERSLAGERSENAMNPLLLAPPPTLRSL